MLFLEHALFVEPVKLSYILDYTLNVEVFLWKPRYFDDIPKKLRPLTNLTTLNLTQVDPNVSRTNGHLLLPHLLHLCLEFAAYQMVGGLDSEWMSGWSFPKLKVLRICGDMNPIHKKA